MTEFIVSRCDALDRLLLMPSTPEDEVYLSTNHRRREWEILVYIYSCIEGMSI